MMTYIYVLKLAGGHYYVGKTSRDPGVRLLVHIHKRGSAWTRKFDVVGMPYHDKTDKQFEETRLTLQFMKEFGIEKVRGGIFTRVVLTDTEIMHIKTEIAHEDGKCLICGLAGHFVSNCTTLKKKNTTPTTTSVKKIKYTLTRSKKSTSLRKSNGFGNFNFHKQIYNSEYNGNCLCVLDGNMGTISQSLSDDGQRVYSSGDSVVTIEYFVDELKRYVGIKSCPTCSHALVKRNKRTYFYGCSTYKCSTRKGCKTKIYLPVLITVDPSETLTDSSKNLHTIENTTCSLQS